MPRKRQRTRVFGPYQHRRRWRLVLRHADGSESVESFGTKAEAEGAKHGIESALQTQDHWAEVARLEAELDQARARALSGGQARTVREVMTDYLDDKRREIRPVTLYGYEKALVNFLKPVLDQPIASISSKRAADLYRTHADGVDVATHRHRLACAKRLWQWAAEDERKWAAQGVWDRVKPKGRVRKGKEQPRHSEAELIYQRAFELAESQDSSPKCIGGLVIATQLLLGLRSSELVNAVGRDIDHGRWYVEDSKSPNGIRAVEIPSRLLPLLEQRASEVGPDGRVFPYNSAWPRKRLQALCVELGIRKYTAHALRGLHGSLAVRAGATSHDVARTLGHGSPVITEGHYIAPEAKQQRAAADRREFWENFSAGSVSQPSPATADFLEN